VSLHVRRGRCDSRANVLTALPIQLHQQHLLSDTTTSNLVSSQQQRKERRLKVTTACRTQHIHRHQSTPGAKIQPSPTTASRHPKRARLSLRQSLTFLIRVGAQTTATHPTALASLPTSCLIHQVLHIRTSPQHPPG
jgi:hypothetical protein